MKKYKVLREMPFMRVGQIVNLDNLPVMYINRIEELVSEGWLAEVPEEKELWEKIGNSAIKYNNFPSDEICKEVAKIARQHFAEVARKANKKWNDDFYTSLSLGEYIIQAIESYGEK